jgi:hypothetical protein
LQRFGRQEEAAARLPVANDIDQHAPPAPAPAAPLPARYRVWHEGREIIERLTGKPPSSSRQIAGRLLALLRDDCGLLLELLRHTQEVNPICSVPFLFGLVRDRRRRRTVAETTFENQFDAMNAILIPYRKHLARGGLEACDARVIASARPGADAGERMRVAMTLDPRPEQPDDAPPDRGADLPETNDAEAASMPFDIDIWEKAERLGFVPPESCTAPSQAVMLAAEWMAARAASQQQGGAHA